MENKDITLENGTVLPFRSQAWIDYMNESYRKSKKKEEEREPLLFKPLEGNCTSFMYDRFRDSTFDVMPMLETLSWHSPSEMAEYLDEALHNLTMHYINDNTAINSAMTVLVLCDVRNAIMKGAGLFNFRTTIEEHHRVDREKRARVS